jgi:hypothetical protein
VLEDAGRLVAAWNERQATRMPMLFSPTIGLRAQGKALVPVGMLSTCRTTQAVDLRTLNRYPWSAISSLIPALS